MLICCSYVQFNLTIVILCIQAEWDKEEVNSWAEKETKGPIKEIVPQKLKLEPPLHLANVLYFKRAWERAFDASWTQHYDFHLLNGETIKDPFMTTSWVISPTSMIHLRISSLSSSHLRYANTWVTNNFLSTSFSLIQEKWTKRSHRKIQLGHKIATT